MKYFLILILVILSTAVVSAQTDSALVRIRTDTDSTKIQINNQDVLEDSYGNTLVKNSWFILNLPIETYNLKITSLNYNPIDSTITLIKGEIYTFDIKFKEIIYEDTTDYYESLTEDFEVVKLVVQSEPDSCSFVIEQNTIEKSTPFELFFRPGEYSFLATKEGYEPLKSTIKIEQKIPLLANFILRDFKPEEIMPESLGLNYMSQLPLLNAKSADNIKVKYNSLAESFAIFPMAQGILARIVVDKSQYRIAETLIISGVGLTLGSYFLGKFLYKKKKQYIIDENIRRESDNAMADENNRQVDMQVNDENIARLKAWQRKNRNKGQVVIETDYSEPALGIQ